MIWKKASNLSFGSDKDLLQFFWVNLYTKGQGFSIENYESFEAIPLNNFLWNKINGIISLETME